MPTSAKTFDKEMEELLAAYVEKGMTRFLDVGAGSGKYREMLNALRTWEKNDFLMDAIEPDPDYITKYELHMKYNYLYITTIEGFVRDYPTYCTNVVIFGDVLEHLPKSMGIDIIEHFIYRSNFIVIIIPEKLIQFDGEHPYENHNSVWKPEDFIKHRATILEKNNKLLVKMPGFFNYPDAVISKSSYEIMKEQGCTRFRGTIMDKG